MRISMISYFPGPLRLGEAFIAELGDLHAVIWCWSHFLHILGRVAASVRSKSRPVF